MDCTKGSCFDSLRDVYRCFLTGSSPSNSAAEVASFLLSGLSAPVPGEDRDCVPAGFTCTSLTLVEKMTATLTSGSQAPEVLSYCTEVLSRLRPHTDLTWQLVNLLQIEDQIISHLAAKSLSAGVVYHIHTSGKINPIWQHKCVQVFHTSPPGVELDACLWSLTDVMKKLIRGAHHENLGKLVADFDFSVCVLCSRFLPKENMQTQSISGRCWTTTFCLLLDLLEVLTSSRSTSDMCLQSQRLTHLHSSALLDTVGCTSHSFVKRRVLLLLKRAALQKAGEDWALVPSPGPTHKCLTSDMILLSETVLTPVAADWLHNVQIESSSFFGGTKRVRYDNCQKSDSVILRAVTLLLLKSIELRIHSASETADVNGVSQPCGYLQRLWTFLKQSDVQLAESSHLCCRLSLVFRDQDDDAVEAAKLVLSLHHRLCPRSDEASATEAACAYGCNPHCHFLFLLQSFSFDYSMVLDFLISNETCFLEYFVRYLKFLTVDLQGFTAACESICMSDSCSTCSCHSNAKTSLAAGPRLVEYDSSDECDQENSSVTTLDRNQGSGGPQKRQQGLSVEGVSAQNTSCETLARTFLCLSELKEVVRRLQTKKLFPFNPSSLLKLLARVQACFQQQSQVRR